MVKRIGRKKIPLKSLFLMDSKTEKIRSRKRYNSIGAKRSEDKLKFPERTPKKLEKKDSFAIATKNNSIEYIKKKPGIKKERFFIRSVDFSGLNFP